MRRFGALVAVAFVASCAKVLGIDDSVSSIDDLCGCEQLSRGDLNQQCKILADARMSDAKFLDGFVNQGCPACSKVNACLELLGASADGASCKEDRDCASTQCCADGCQSDHHACSGPAPHCTTLFSKTADCLVLNHGSLCPMCPASGPTVVNDDCWSCLTKSDASLPKCQDQIAACLAEVL